MSLHFLRYLDIIMIPLTVYCIVVVGSESQWELEQRDSLEVWTIEKVYFRIVSY